MGDGKYGHEYRKNAARLKREAPWICMLCGGDIPKDAPTKDPLSWSADHITPYAHGGTDDIANLQPAHHGCNSKRQDRDSIVISKYKGSKQW